MYQFQSVKKRKPLISPDMSIEDLALDKGNLKIECETFVYLFISYIYMD